MKTNKEKKKMRQVYIEESFWLLLRRLSLIQGCDSHPSAGSASEALRKFAKKAVIDTNKQLLNYEKEKIDWSERY